MGAWIEMIILTASQPFTTVAPFMGAWIEIVKGLLDFAHPIGRSLHGSVD